MYRGARDRPLRGGTAAAADRSTASEHRCPRGIEGVRPGPGLMRAERGNLARVRPAGAGRCGPAGRPIVRGAEPRWRDRVPGKRMPAAERQREGECRRAGSPPGRCSYNWPDSERDARARKGADVGR